MLSRGEFIQEREAIPVEIGMANGTCLKGRLWVIVGKSLADTLNAGSAFLEFTCYGEEVTGFLAKSQVASLKPINVPRAVLLEDRRDGSDTDDPYRVLGIETGASWLSVREAYLRLAKTHHPDRYASVQLPSEVKDYLDSKAQRVNAAYATLEDSFKRAAGATQGQPAHRHAV